MAKIEPGMESMLEMYIFETGSLLQQLDEILLRTENANVFSDEDINEIFRIMHTIKGSSAMMGFDNLQKLAHKGEDMFFVIREKPEVAKDAPFVYDLIFEVSDLYKSEIDYIQNTGDDDYTPTDFSDTINRLIDAAAKLKAKASGQAASEASSGDSGYTIPVGEGIMTVKVQFDDGCKMENLRAFLLLNKIKEEGEIIGSYPKNVDTDASTAKYIAEHGFLVSFKGFEGNNDNVLKVIENAVNVQSYEVVEAKAEQPKEPEKPAAVVGAPVADDKASTEQKKENAAVKKAQDDIKKAGGGQKQSLISVNLTKLDHLHDVVGEIITTESMVIANPDLNGLKLDSFSKAARQLRKLTEELQDTVMSIRMVPVAGVFQKMGRIVRDMKMKLNKDAQLVLEGENTEVDKSIVDSLNDPLMHLVRNCMDHGIENDPNERVDAGKPAQATVKLSARQSSGEVIITVSDDGAGINCEKVLKKAAKSGILTKPESEYSKKEIRNMILLPGFSTNEQVTEYSGRGVGMDVVKQNIEQVGGTLYVESEEGVGTSFIIRIPLTLAIIDGMKMAVGDTVFTVPIAAIKESLLARGSKIISDTDKGEMIIVRGTCFPVIRLYKHFGIDTKLSDLDDGIMLLVEFAGKQAALFVDKLIGEQPVVVKPFPKYLSRFNVKQKGLSGCTILGDGTISLIIDVNTLINAG